MNFINLGEQYRAVSIGMGNSNGISNSNSESLSKMANKTDSIVKEIRDQKDLDIQKAKEELLIEKQENEQRAKKRREEEQLKEQQYQKFLRSKQQVHSRKLTCSDKSYVLMFNFIDESPKKQAKIINNVLIKIKKEKIKSEIIVGLFGNKTLFLRNSNVESLTTVDEKEIVLMTETKIINAMRETTCNYVKLGLKDQQTSFIFYTNSLTDESTYLAESIKVYADDFQFKYVLVSFRSLFQSNCIISRKISEGVCGEILDIILIFENKLERLEI